MDDVNQKEDDSWDAIWDSAGRLTEQGFVVEMAIPFSQLRFARTDGEREWGIDVLRFRPRAARTRISNNALERGRNCYVCQFERVRGLAGVETGKNLELVPSLTAGRTDRRANPAVDPWAAGLDRQRCRLERALGGHTRRHGEPCAESGLLSGRGRRRAARGQQPIRVVLP